MTLVVQPGGEEGRDGCAQEDRGGHDRGQGIVMIWLFCLDIACTELRHLATETPINPSSREYHVHVLMDSSTVF
jgi:hypothetical protein